LQEGKNFHIFTIVMRVREWRVTGGPKRGAVVHLSRGTIAVISCAPGFFAHCVRCDNLRLIHVLVYDEHSVLSSGFRRSWGGRR